jgi:hypothetical protein
MVRSREERHNPTHRRSPAHLLRVDRRDRRLQLVGTGTSALHCAVEQPDALLDLDRSWSSSSARSPVSVYRAPLRESCSSISATNPRTSGSLRMRPAMSLPSRIASSHSRRRSGASGAAV